MEQTQQQTPVPLPLLLMKKMAQVMAHDIRNPLNNILLSTAQFKSGNLPDAEDTAFFIDIIERNCDRLNSLMEEILQAMQPLPAAKGSCNPILVAQDLVKQVEDKCALRNVQCSLQSSGEATLAVPSGQFEKVLHHLLDNAVEAAPERDGRILLDLTAKNETLIITVSDNGPGIPEERQDEIFLPFFTTKDRHRGLGLCFVQQFVSAHRGHIEMVSNSDGTSITLVLPAKTV
jgi:signal transduction histidine kinase